MLNDNKWDRAADGCGPKRRLPLPKADVTPERQVCGGYQEDLAGLISRWP